MKVEYKHEANKNMMILIPTEPGEEMLPEGDAWQLRMLERNRMEGILEVRTHQENGELRYRYDISARHSLEAYLQGNPLEAEDIRKLLWGIQVAAASLEDHLLSPDLLVMDPRCIFPEEDFRKVSFCALPGKKEGLHKSLREMLHDLLDYLNYDDKQGVMAVYGMYRLTGEENYRLEELLSFLSQEGEPVSEIRENEEIIETEQKPIPLLPRKNKEASLGLIPLETAMILAALWVVYAFWIGRSWSLPGKLPELAALVLGEAAGLLLVRFQKKRGAAIVKEREEMP